MILHIPHSATSIPEQYANLFCVVEEDLARESLALTDRYTDELFESEEAERVVFPYSRLLVDVERFRDEADEPMSKVGMGAIYMCTTNGRPLKHALEEATRQSLLALYDDHHQQLSRATDQSLSKQGLAMIVDCHSFPDPALPCDMNQDADRPDFCIGTDSYHTPEGLADELVEHLRAAGFRAEINMPYAGTLVPIASYHKDPQVRSVMIEVNRKLYMDQQTGEKLPDFNAARTLVGELLDIINQFARSAT